VQKIEKEKRDYVRKYETLEFQSFELQEKLLVLQNEKEQLELLVSKKTERG